MHRVLTLFTFKYVKEAVDGLRYSAFATHLIDRKYYKKAKHVWRDTIPTAKLTCRIGQDQL